jgi:hypothetical protein
MKGDIGLRNLNILILTATRRRAPAEITLQINEKLH